jgi:hypothetical protein
MPLLLEPASGGGHGPQVPTALPTDRMQLEPGQQSPSMEHWPQACTQEPPW